MAKVIIRKASYDYEVLRPLVFEFIESLAGGLIRKGSRVLVKPNLLAPAKPPKAMLTHPLVVRAVVEYVLRKGGIPQVSDSPAMGSFEKVLRESGIRDGLAGLDVRFSEFERSVPAEVGEPFKKIEIAEEAVSYDVVINLPKMKTHAQMLLTLGVKNLFGCIVGMRKPEWHFRTGIDREMFARLLVRIYGAVRPQVTILDAVLAMEGQGPGKSGTPRHLGLLVASDDAIALDMTVCSILSLPPKSLLTNKAAEEFGLAPDTVRVDGEVPVVEDFRLPGMSPLIFGPLRFHKVMRKHFVQRPIPDVTRCRLCGECWKYCPAKAISRDEKRIRFDYDTCIRCYCCIEVCPYGALRAGETLPGKIVRKMIRIRK